MSRLHIRNSDPARALVVRVWHPSNALMSDGDCAWLDEEGVPTAERSRDHCLLPGETMALALRGEVAFTVLADAAAESEGVVGSVRRYFRTGSTDSGGGVDAPFSLTSEAETAVRVRVFASAMFQFSPLREVLLGGGETLPLSTGETGVTLRVG